MNKIELVRQSVDQHLGNVNDLLAMRLIFPPEQSVVSIEKEILDLYLYPERLETSYQDEWKSIALKAVYKKGFPDQWRTDQDNLDVYLGFLRDQAIPRCIHDHLSLFQTLEEIMAIQRSDNTITFPDPKRQALMRLIWPEEKG
jgi:hypothetical protein